MKSPAAMILIGIAIGVVIVLLCALVMLASLNTTAIGTPGRLEESVAISLLNRSIKKHAPATANPVALTPEALNEGLSHYKENCLVCHGAPLITPGEIGKGLNPPPPDLTSDRVQERTDGELFWIVGQGIRWTGMPAFSPTHEEDEIWKIVAFIRHLPKLSAEERTALKAGTEEEEHHHEAGEGIEASGSEKQSGEGKTTGEPKGTDASPEHHHHHHHAGPGTGPHGN